MMTQMEGEWANDGWATLTILTLEYLYQEHHILLGHPELVAYLNNDEERKIFAENLLYALERQVSYSRAQTLDGNLVDTMFFEEDGTEERDQEHHTSTGTCIFVGFIRNGLSAYRN